MPITGADRVLAVNGVELTKLYAGDTVIWEAETGVEVPAPAYDFDWHEGGGSSTADVAGSGATLLGSAWSGQRAAGEFTWGPGTPAAYSGPMTTAIDFQLGATSGYRTLVRFGKQGGGQLWIHCHDSKPDVYLNSEYQSAVTVSTNTDYRLVVVSNAGAWAMYLGGVLIKSFSDPIVMIVAKSDMSVRPGPADDVIIDRWRIWNSALTAGQIAALT